MIESHDSIHDAVNYARGLMRDYGETVHTEKWQSWDIKDRPEAQMVEVLHHSLVCPMKHSGPKVLAEETGANMPWAENHFHERVCGYPLNPGKEWENWPWGGHADKHREGELFNHNYMERYWPRLAGCLDIPTRTAEDFMDKIPTSTLVTASIGGIRGEYGDLDDLIQQLAEEPLTRQAYLPVWFPEDTGAQNKGRKPCTLGYHFIMRKGKLDVVYYIRSCDLFRHFSDDIYLTIRLAKHVLLEAQLKNQEAWGNVELGNLVMHISSLHMFVNDYRVMFKRNPS